MRIHDLLRRMLDEGASDLLVTAGKPPYLRASTALRALSEPPVTDEEVHAFRQSVLLPEPEREFRRLGSFDAGLTLDAGLRFRINFFLQQGHPGLAARLVPSGELDFAHLGLPEALRAMAEAPRGLLLVVGPAGSGKSTTMAAVLHHLNANFARHIVTIEDPIEFIHRDRRSLVTQREVGADTASFADALRNVVRETPDAIFIGEMRDLETMQTAINAALTGHLVVSTLHSADTIQCVERIVNHFPDHLREQAAADLAMALVGIVAQRLVPRADGQGIVPAVEVLRATPHARQTIGRRQFADLEEIIRRGAEEGMQTFSRALADLCKGGVIRVDDGARVATNREEFLLLVQGMESGVESFRDDSGHGQEETLLNMRRLLHTAVANGASDLLLTVGAKASLRVDGELSPLATETLTATDSKRLLFSVLNAHQRARFEEDREIDLALTVGLRRDATGKTDDPIPYRFRVNGFYQRGNVAIAVRVIPRRIPGAEELGLPKVLLDLIGKKQGLLLVTGPTGHGKSTTLACLVDHINRERACHIITVEDPIEYVHDNHRAVVEQREVLADTRSFATALKYVLRQDPDVILVGEMRDPETIGAALTAAETGHLVLATLHTNNAHQTIDRVIDSFPAHQQNQVRLQFAGSILGVVAQRLIPRRDGKGRVAAFEVMVGTDAIRALIRENKTHLALSAMETGAKNGMVTMDRALKDLYERNLIRRQDAAALMRTDDLHR
jgi:twitching motility protein PilT